MGHWTFKNVLCRLFHLSANAVLILGVIAFMPGLPPDVEFKSFQINFQPLPHLNGKLNNAELLFLNELKGPEDLAVYKNELYVTTHGGYVQKISQDKLIPVVKFGKKCKGLYQEHICGRPLGLVFDAKGLMYVIDAYYGIFKVNVSSGLQEHLVSVEDPIDDIFPMIPNSIAVSEKNGDIYWTDSSTSHKLHDGVYTMLMNGNGRLIKYNAATGKNEVLLKNLHFPNGIVLSKDESFVVISETFNARLLKYSIKGVNAGQAEVFTELPGFPDNLRYIDGQLTTSLIGIPDSTFRLLLEYPMLRRLIVRMLTFFELILNGMHYFYPNTFIEEITHWIGHFESLKSLKKAGPVLIMTFSESGKLVNTLSAIDNKINDISAIVSHQGYYYLGSPFNNYLARVKIA